jgi:2,4-didehydro-3-deoxy-L-rhamnonate hydrolase
MRIVRYGPKGRERPGVLDQVGQIRDLSREVADILPEVLAPKMLTQLMKLDLSTLPVVAGNHRLGTPLVEVGKIVCIGLNYADHAAESGLPVPEKPVIFLKATTAINGPTDPIVVPKQATATDWEIELGVVIGSIARYVDVDQAIEHVAGYCIGNDVSERNFSEEGGGQWTKGKSADTFAPLGPWLVTPDEISDPQQLGMQLEVNGHIYQNSSTSEMVFGVAELVSYVSQFMTLSPGDVLLTGTPYGTGYGQRPQVYLQPGDVLRLRIDRLGEQVSPVVPWSR